MADGDENAQRPYLGHRMDRRAHTIIGNLSSMLAPGEQVWALFAVNSLRPQADFLVVTNCRVATGLAYTLREKGAFKEVAFADQLADVDKKGRVTATSADGDAFRLAALLYTAKDLPSLTHYVDFLRESPAPTEMLEVVKGIQSGAFVPPPPEQVYLGSVRKVDLAASVEGAQASLVPGEQLRALFAIKGPGGARLLAFTSARVVGLVAVDDQSLPKPLWAVSNTDVINLTASRSHGGITALVQRAEDAMRTDLGSLRETSDARALDYFGASPATPDDEVTEGLTLSALPRPGEQPAPSGYPSPAAVATASGVTDAIVRSRTQAEEAALNEGLPPKEVDLVTPILKGFAQAVEASARGDIEAEEQFLRGVGRTAEQAGLTTRRKVVAWANREMAKLVVSGELRRGSENIANIGGSLQVFSDRLLHRGHCYVIDRDVHASVELDGQILESTRPTLTRMAIGSVLPGSALIVGLALPKKSTDDRRSARFIVVGPRWRIVERLDPDKAPATRSIAAQINAIAGSLARTGAMPPPAAALPTPLEAARQPDTVADQLAKLEKVEELLSRGALSKEQADQIRQRILGD